MACDRADSTEGLLALIGTRQHVAPRRLVAPGPSAGELTRLLEAAAAAPDHGSLRPWRLVIVSERSRAALGEAFAAALRERDAAATADQLAAAREKASRGPLLMLMVARPRGGDAAIPAIERLVAAGCAVQNLLLASHALGFGAGLSSGHSLRSSALRRFFGLGDEEDPVCFITVGTVARARPPRERPAPQALCSTV